MEDLKLLEYHFVFLILIFWVANPKILHLKCYIVSFHIDIALKQNKFTILIHSFLWKKHKFTVPYEKSEMASFVYSVIKCIAVCPIWFRFAVKWFAVFLLRKHIVLVVYLTLLLSSYNNFWNVHNPVDNRLYSHFLDLSQFLEKYHMLFDHFLLDDQKRSIAIIL